VKTKRNVVIVVVLALLVGAWASVRIAENAGFVFVIAPLTRAAEGPQRGERTVA
jgi:hypothetical protein